MSGSPRVTVLIPVYNRARHVAMAIDSVLAQTLPDFELVVVDDGSTDGTPEIVRAYSDSRVRLIRHQSNQGVPRTRNRGLQEARGEYVAMLDSDDYAYPERLERQVAFLDRNPDHALVGSRKRRMDARGRPVKRLKGFKRRPCSAEAVQARLLFRCCIAQTSVMGRTALLRAFGYREAFSAGQEFDLFVRLSRHHRIANLRDVLVCYRSHPGQMSERRAEVENTYRAVMREQLQVLGVEFSETDLSGHFRLTRPLSWFRPDLEYLAWTEAWLHRLARANRASGVYPADVFHRTLGGVWSEVCFKGARSMGARALHRFWRSPWRGAAWSGVWR